MDKVSSSYYVSIKIAAYFLFLFSGLVKWIPFPVDFTLFSGLLLLVFIANDAYKKSFKLYNLTIGYLYVTFYVFVLVYMLSFFYTDSKIYALIKVKGFVLNTIAFTFPITSIKVEDFNKIVQVVTILTLLMIVFFCYLLYVDLFDLILTNEDDQLKFFFTSLPSYLSYGALLCISFILLLNNNSFIAVVYKLIIFYFLIILTGRGPLLTLILILIFNYLLRNKNFNFIKYLKYLFVFVLVAAVYVYFEFEFFDFERFNVFSNYKSDESVSSRFIYIQKCLDGFLDSPIFGNGIGSTGLLISGNDTVLYPHNLFVEVLSECGLIGFILYLSIFVFSIVIIYAKKIPFEYFPILLVVLFIFIQDMKSGAFEAWRISCGLLSIATIFLNYNFMPKDSFSDNQVNKRISANCE